MKPSNARNVMVCSLNRATCHRLVQAGNDIAEESGLPLTVLSIQPQGLVSSTVAQNIQVLHNITSRAGAEANILFSDSPALTLAVHAKQTNAAHILIDRADFSGNFFLKTIVELLPEVTVSVLEQDGRIITFSPANDTMSVY